MQREQLLNYQNRLEAIRQDTERTLSDLEQELSMSLSDSISEFAIYDNHPADVASETFERGKDLALREDQRQELTEVDAALERIDDGTFGRCVVCGEPIPEERLQAIPYAPRCLRCQLEQEDPARDRPIEESMENEMLRQSFTDDDPQENVGYDGEDAWQELARYGTSNTPGDFRQVEDYNDVDIDPEEQIGTVFEVESLPKSYEASRQEFLKPKEKK